MLRNYTRWREAGPDCLEADILGAKIPIAVDSVSRTIRLGDVDLTPDEARMIGVRLIDGAVLADGEHAIRRAATAASRTGP